MLEGCVGQQVPLIHRGATDGPSTLLGISVGRISTPLPCPFKGILPGLAALHSLQLSSLQGDTIVVRPLCFPLLLRLLWPWLCPPPDFRLKLVA